MREVKPIDLPRAPPHEQGGEIVTVSALIWRLNQFQRQGVRVSKSSLFGDDAWDFSMENPTRCKRDVCINFSIEVEPNVRLTDGKFPGLVDSLKCLAYSLLFDPPSSKLGLGTIVKGLNRGHGIGNLYWYLAFNGFSKVADIDEGQFSDMLDFFRKLPIKGHSNRPISDRTLRARLHAIEWLRIQNTKLVDRLSFLPWAQDGGFGRWVRKNAKVIKPRGELATQPWSDELLGALVQQSMMEVERAPDLLRRYAEGESPRVLKGGYDRLRSSVALLTGCFTGMRCSELLSIPESVKDSCSERIERYRDHEIHGYFVTATLRKWQPIPKGEEWQTIPMVHHAIGSLASINEQVANKESPFLFRTNFCQRPSAQGRMLSSSTFVEGLNKLAKYYRIDLSEVGGRIKAMEMRRTFARVTTRGGFGLLELQSQLKHRDPALAMQYGAPGIREYLAEEKENWSRDQYVELLESGDTLIGGGAIEFDEVRRRYVGLTRTEKDVFLKALPRRALIDQVGLGLCLYRPDRALCGGEKVSCRPAECGNSILKAQEAVKTLQFMSGENERLLKIFAKQPAKRAHLKTQQLTLRKLLDQAAEDPQSN